MTKDKRGRPDHDATHGKSGHTNIDDQPTQHDPTLRRRQVLLGGLAGLSAAPLLLRPDRAEAADPNPAKLRAQAGDLLVFRRGEREGEPIKPSDVEIGAKPLVAYPFDPVNNVMRKGSRLNQLLVLRLPEDGYSDEVRARAADGVIAYSAICTHQNCPVTGWHPDDLMFICPCHETHYDPNDGARVVSGPARRPLPALPLTVKDGVLVAADGLTGKVGRRKTS